MTGGGLAEDLVEPFQIDDYTRWRLMEGLDDIGLTLRHEDAIAAFEARPPLAACTLSGPSTACVGAKARLAVRGSLPAAVAERMPG